MSNPDEDKKIDTEDPATEQEPPSLREIGEFILDPHYIEPPEDYCDIQCWIQQQKAEREASGSFVQLGDYDVIQSEADLRCDLDCMIDKSMPAILSAGTVLLTLAVIFAIWRGAKWLQTRDLNRT